MANQNVASHEQEVLVEAVSKTELFFKKNGKKLSYALVLIVVVAVAIFGYKAMVVEPREQKASDLIYMAQSRFEAVTPDFELALNGDAQGAGFLEVIENYGSTPAGNLAKHYAGICYLKLNDLDNAANYLAQYKSVKGIPGAIINAQNLGLQGDIAVDKGDFAKAISLYNKAVSSSDNELTAPMYMRKSAIASIAAGDKATAKKQFEAIKAKYPSSADAREADKFIGTLE